MMIPCPDCENGRVEMEVRRTRGGDFITAWDTCLTCKGEGEINQRNTIEEIKIMELARARWTIVFVRTNGEMKRTGSWDSAYRLERILTDLVNEGQYDVVYEGLTRGVVTFHPAQLPY